MQMEDKTLERYWKMAREETFEPDSKEGTLFVIINGMLYRKVDRIFEDSVRLQLVVPVKLRNIVLNAAYKSQSSTLQRIRMMQFRVDAVFYWPMLKDDVERYDDNRELCGSKHEIKPFDPALEQSICDQLKMLKKIWSGEEDKVLTMCEFAFLLEQLKEGSETCRITQEELVKDPRKSKKFDDKKGAAVEGTIKWLRWKQSLMIVE